MRHFISYGPDKQFVGVHTHKFARGGLGGWSEDFDLENGLEAVNDAARAMAQRLITAHPGVIEGFVVYDCACPATMGSCRCPNERRVDAIACPDGCLVVPKPECAVLIDDVLWDGTSEVVRPPGTSLVLKVQCAEAEDGATVTLGQASTPRLWSPLEQVELAFTGGVTPGHTIVVPPRSLTGMVQFYGKCVRMMNMQVAGWE